MSARSLALAALASSVLVAAPAAVADPNPDNNKNAVERTLTCSDGETLPSTFAGLEGSDFNITGDQRVFVYKWINIDELPSGTSGADVTTNRGLQGISDDRLVTCHYYTGTDAYVTAIGFFTGPNS